jgi:outer membrane protein OmpA-like peptidoglycan-associated protein
MMRRLVLPLSVLAVPIVVLGCAPFRAQTSDIVPSRPLVKRVLIEQVALGPNAAYAHCAEETCPKPTPKTALGLGPLASASPALEERVPMPVSLAQASARSDVPPETLATKTDVIVIGFSSGDCTLTPETRKALRAKLPIARAATQIVIRGRTDSAGPANGNERLALLRAVAVRDFMLRNEVQARHTVKLDVKGACCYVAENETAQGRARNRRVEVEFVLPQTKGVSSL